MEKGKKLRCWRARVALAIGFAMAAVSLLVVSPGPGAEFAQAASPASGTMSTSNTSLSWTGSTFTVGATTIPDECPPTLDPAGLLCDHFYLTVNLPADYWSSNDGGVQVTLHWGSSENDFDLYVYDSSGRQVASSASGGTTGESALIKLPANGTYEVRVVPFLVVNSDYTGSAALITAPKAGNPSRNSGGIGFAPPVLADAQRTMGEPEVHVGPDGALYTAGPWGTSTQQGFLQKSTDNGDGFHIVSSLGLRSDPPPGGGDSSVVIDDQNRIYYSDLEGLINIGVGRSDDGGNTWLKNALTTDDTVDDRQWLVIDNGTTPAAADDTVFLFYRGLATGVSVRSSADGLVYSDAAAEPIQSGAPCGRPVFDTVNRYLYSPCAQGRHVSIARAYVAPGQRTGLQFTVVNTPDSPAGSVGDIFPSIAVDLAGNLYAVWVDEADHNVYYSASTNRGDTWTAPLQVNGNDAYTNVFAWTVAGADGHLGIAWLGTNVKGNPGSFTGWYQNRQGATNVQWHLYAAQVANATSATPTVYQVKAVTHPMHYGQLCTGGLGCVSGGDRTMADFFVLTKDHNGAMRIVFNDTTNQYHGAGVFVAQQVTGPSLNGGTLSTVTAGGADAATLTNAVQVSDPSGDAQFPHYAATGAGPNWPAYDLTGLTLRQPDADHLTVSFRVADASDLTPPDGATAGVWLVRWQALSKGDAGETANRIFYVGARAEGGAAPTFFSGTGYTKAETGTMGDGCLYDGNCKVVQYPAEQAADGTFDAATGTFTITVPLSAVGPVLGDRLYSVTGLTFGVTSPDPFYKDVDATRAFDYMLQGTQTSVTPVKGGGAILADGNGALARFNLHVKASRTGKIHYRDDVAGVNFSSIRITSVVTGRAADGAPQAVIRGEGVANGNLTSFTVTVVDRATPGTGADEFAIQFHGYSLSGLLQSGDIQIGK